MGKIKSSMQLRRFVQQSYRIHKLPQAILIGMFIFILSACSGESTPDALPTLVEVPENVPTNTAVPATEVVIVTDEPGQTEAVEPTTESEGIARANGVFDYQTDDGSLRLIIHTINTAETTPNFPEGAEGFKYLQLTGNLQNFTGEAFYVEPESLTLIDDSGNRYSLVSPDDYLAGKSDMPPLAYYSLSVQVGRVWVLSAPVEAEYIHDMMNALTAKFKSYEGMRAFSSRGSIISSNDGGTRAVAVDISGSELTELYQAAEAVYRQAEQVFDNPQINSDPSSLTLSQPLIEIKPRWQRINELGISPSEFRYTVAAISDGAFVDEFILNDDKVDIFLFSDAGNQQSIEQLSRAPIVTPSGQVLPLNALADLVESKNSDNLRRIDGRRTVTVYIIPPRNLALETAEAMVRTELLPALWQ